MKNNDNLQAKELMNIMSRQIRALDELDLTSKTAPMEIFRSREIFNGSGKIIKLSQYMHERETRGTPNDKLLPE